MKRFLSIAFAVIPSASTSVVAQEDVGTIQSPIVIERNLVIKNLSDSVRVNFRLREEHRGPWRSLALEPGQASDFRCGRWCDFSIRTGDMAPMLYGLEPHKRYGIYWNEEIRAWDIALASED